MDKFTLKKKKKKARIEKISGVDKFILNTFFLGIQKRRGRGNGNIRNTGMFIKGK